jgi:hypothetical protein
LSPLPGQSGLYLLAASIEIAFIPGGENFIKRDDKVGNIKIEYK